MAEKTSSLFSFFLFLNIGSIDTMLHTNIIPTNQFPYYRPQLYETSDKSKLAQGRREKKGKNRSEEEGFLLEDIFPKWVCHRKIDFDDISTKFARK